jgi:hypothetical protein
MREWLVKLLPWAIGIPIVGGFAWFFVSSTFFPDPNLDDAVMIWVIEDENRMAIATNSVEFRSIYACQEAATRLEKANLHATVHAQCSKK